MVDPVVSIKLNGMIMSKRKVTVDKVQHVKYQVVTFRPPHEMLSPGYFSGQVGVIRYRVSVETIDDSVSEITERLLSLWRTADALWQKDLILTEARRLNIPISLFVTSEFGANVGNGRRKKDDTSNGKAI